ncbi:HAD family hydrolase [Sporomusa acidovorans]|uniref:Phosphoglycolate phosphatase n=1 Tax=Sporomusa acidovorans (strain ATCC 49682 / DSM 3132 / Mol) TaxID=1123286 RepID=A0ABZ3J7K4_SPOA4|nr:HAD family hydrolase [Sporomusa acidovorans]OZC21217.1 phosphoglycolate phosphatase [Sporomusa acidovorans DSM 3132]SDE65089.1 phosphoglycolate phosphatase [Sporomusa acidovorans]
MKPSKLVMFDYDGVIVDSLEVFCESYIGACQDNGLYGIKTQKDVLTLFENNVYAALQQQGVPLSIIDKILEDYERRQSKHLLGLHLFANMADALRAISKKNKVFIITSNISAATESVMRKHGVACFEEIIGAEKEKSKIRKIEKIRARFPGLPAFYVGDTKGDMMEGKAAGTTAVGVTWGWHSREQLAAGGADFIVWSPQELVALLLR